MKAHQRTVREQRESVAGKDNLFGEWWRIIDTDISKAVVKKVNYNTAKAVIEEYEWLKCMPLVSLFCYGIYFEGNCGGVVVYSPEYAENLGVWDKYGFTGKMLLLSRGACVHWAPPNSASKLIRGSMRLLPPQYEVITATVDPLAGEVGTIYQACGFNYVGQMRASKARFGIELNGKVLGERAVRNRFGHQRLGELRKTVPKLKSSPN